MSSKLSPALSSALVFMRGWITATWCLYFPFRQMEKSVQRQLCKIFLDTLTNAAIRTGEQIPRYHSQSMPWDCCPLLVCPAFPVPCCSRDSSFQRCSCLHDTPPPLLCFCNLSSNYLFSSAQWSILPPFSFSPSPGIPPVNYFSFSSSSSPLLCPPQQPRHCLHPHGELSVFPQLFLLRREVVYFPFFFCS